VGSVICIRDRTSRDAGPYLESESAGR
jgi:hypothetical protein